MGKYKIDLYAKDLAYRALQPVASELDMQLLILDPKTYRTMLDFGKRLERFGISPSEVQNLQAEMDDGSAVAVFKSKKYYGAPEIAPHFAKWNLDADAIHYMRSADTKDSTYPPRFFLYWINIDVLDERGNAILETKTQEENSMKKQYTKKQIVEAINYWKNQLKMMNESIVEYEDEDEITIYRMLKEVEKVSSNALTDRKFAPIVGIVDGHLADFTNFTFARHDKDDPGTFFLHDGTPDSLAMLEEQLDILRYRTTNETENPDDAKADDLFIKGDKYEDELKARAELEKSKDKVKESVTTDAADGEEAKRFKQIDPVEFGGQHGFIAVHDIVDAMDNAFPNQQNAILNYGPDGKMLGQVNNIFASEEQDGTYCVMTLAPYKNGSRTLDCSVAGNKNAPLKFVQIRKILASMNPNSVVKVRYKDPFAYGPKVGQVVEQVIGKISIDRAFGIFMRPAEDVKAKVVGIES